MASTRRNQPSHLAAGAENVTFGHAAIRVTETLAATAVFVLLFAAPALAQTSAVADQMSDQASAGTDILGLSLPGFVWLISGLVAVVLGAVAVRRHGSSSNTAEASLANATSSSPLPGIRPVAGTNHNLNGASK